MKTVDDFNLVAVPTSERNPKPDCKIYHVYLDGRLPMMAQCNPQGWCYVDSIPATREPQVIGGKGVSHWIELVPKSL